MSRMLKALKQLEPQLPYGATGSRPASAGGTDSLTASDDPADAAGGTPVLAEQFAGARSVESEPIDSFSAAICHVAEAIQVLSGPIDLPTYPEIAFSTPDSSEPAGVVPGGPRSRPTRRGDAPWADPFDAESAEPYDRVAGQVFDQLSACSAAAVALVSFERTESLLAIVVPLAAALRTHFDSMLVVDCDLREPALADRFAVPAGRGLIDLLPGPARWQEVVRPTQLPGVDLLPGRRLVAADGRPPERLDLRPLVHQWLQRYRLVVLAAGPVGNPETGSLLRAAHAAVLVLEPGRTTQRAARKASRSIRSAGTRLLGSIVVETA